MEQSLQAHRPVVGLAGAPPAGLPSNLTAGEVSWLYHHSTWGSVLPFTPIVGIRVSWLVGDSASQISGYVLLPQTTSESNSLGWGFLGN